MNFASNILAGSYAGFSPFLNLPAAVCVFNGQAMECPAIFLPALGIFFAVFFALGILMIISLWKIYEKAGKPGWATLIPIYNMIVMMEIIKRPIWWVVLMFIPFVNIVIGIIVLLDLAKAFGKNGWFALGLILLSPIFYPILAFGDAVYVGGTTQNASDPSPVPPSNL